MKRAIAGIAAGLVTWLVIAALLNFAMGAAWPGYVGAEPAMTFDLGMQIGRLVNGALYSLGAGFVAGWIAKGSAKPVLVLAVLLLLLFLPVHYRLWDRFPIWYHLTFLASLIPFTLMGARLKTTGSPANTT